MIEQVLASITVCGIFITGASWLTGGVLGVLRTFGKISTKWWIIGALFWVPYVIFAFIFVAALICSIRNDRRNRQQ